MSMNELIEVTNLILGKTAPVAAAAIRDAGYQKVPQGYVVVPGPDRAALQSKESDNG